MDGYGGGGAGARRGARREDPRQLLVPGQPCRGREHGRRAREPAREEVGRDLPGPGRLLDHGPPVVGAHLGTGGGDGAHDRPPTNAAATPTSSAPAAASMFVHICGRSRVVTTGSGGRP